MSKTSFKLNNELYLDTHGIVHGERILADIIYPVGSIYISTNNINPSTLFGGTWEQIQDVFLLSAGQIYSAGDTGGEATHQLTINEMPSHKHNNSSNSFPTWHSTSHSNGLRWDSANGWHTEQLASHFNSVGGNQAHNNMPPYLVVYMWKRTA